MPVVVEAQITKSPSSLGNEIPDGHVHYQERRRRPPASEFVHLSKIARHSNPFPLVNSSRTLLTLRLLGFSAQSASPARLAVSPPAKASANTERMSITLFQSNSFFGCILLLFCLQQSIELCFLGLG